MVTSELVERLGLAFFAAMSSLILICIMIGFYAVYESYSKPGECNINTLAEMSVNL